MNIFLREMKAALKSLFFWTLGMMSLVGVFMWEYEGLASSGTSIGSMMDIYPKSLKALFGLGRYDIDTLMGYFGIVMVFAYIMAGLHAVMLGANLIAKEERERTAEFLMVKPVKWEDILKFKMLAGLANILVLNLSAWVVSAAMLSYFSDEPIGGDLFSIQFLLFIFQLLFQSLGAFMTAVLKTPKAGQFATFIFLGFYFVKVAADLLDSKLLNNLTPFGFLSAERVIIDDASALGAGVTIAGIISAVMLLIAYKIYPKKDINT